MALFKILRGESSSFTTDLQSINVYPEFHDGYCYFTADTGLFYIDYDDGSETTYNQFSGADVGYQLTEGKAYYLFDGNVYSLYEGNYNLLTEYGDPSAMPYFYYKTDGKRRIPLNAKQAEEFLGYSIENVLNDSEVEIPTSSAVFQASKKDWNQNDETAPDYIKNRTHWEEVSWEEVLPLTTVDGFTAVGENGVYSAYYAMPTLDNNSFYSIKFDGVEYFGLGGSLMSSNVANGNAPATENETPFCFVEEYLGAGTYDYYVYVYADGESHTFDILKHVGDIHKIDKKFLPTLIGSKTYNNGEIFNNAMNASYYAHAEGFETIASGNSSHAEGYGSTASGWSSHSENYSTTASGDYSHAEGWNTEASGNGSHTEGFRTTASGGGSHAEGSETIASGDDSHAEGYGTVASGSYSHAECGGNSAPVRTFSSAYYPIIGSNDIEISNTTAYGESSHAEGGNTFAYGEFSHAEGKNTGALGECSHAEGESTTASGDYSHAEGLNAHATGLTAHVEGANTEASGYYAHAEGFSSVASGDYSHAEGYDSTASGESSHTEGFRTTASGNRSHAEGWGTIANSDDQHVQGRYNISDSENKYLHIVGNGNQNIDGVRSNAHTLDWFGNAWFAGDVYVGSTSGTNKDEGSKKLATEEFVDETVANIGSGLPEYSSADNGKFLRVVEGVPTWSTITNTEEVRY